MRQAGGSRRKLSRTYSSWRIASGHNILLRSRFAPPASSTRRTWYNWQRRGSFGTQSSARPRPLAQKVRKLQSASQQDAQSHFAHAIVQMPKLHARSITKLSHPIPSAREHKALPAAIPSPAAVVLCQCQAWLGRHPGEGSPFNFGVHGSLSRAFGFARHSGGFSLQPALPCFDSCAASALM